MAIQITPAQRLSAIGEYYLQRKMKEVAALNAQGLDIVSLGIGGPDMMPPADAIETLCNAARRSDTHSYQLGIGLPELREAFADWYRKYYGVTLDPAKEILPVSGSKEGIIFISLAFVNPGDKVLVPDPGYPTYTSANHLAGAEIVKYDLTQDGGWYPDFDALDQSDLSGVKILWMNYPHMPTGAPARREVFERAVAFGKKHGIVIVNDNPYSFILNTERQSIFQVEGARDIAIELNSLSKAHNMAGWRMGMIATNPTFMSWILKVKSNIDSGQFKPLMLAAAAALKQDEDWFTGLNAEYKLRRQAGEEVMRAMNVEFDPGQRGMFLWGRIPDSIPSGEAFVDMILNEARVFITPGFIFGKNGERYVRISLCAPVEKLKEAARRISACLK